MQFKFDWGMTFVRTTQHRNAISLVQIKILCSYGMSYNAVDMSLNQET